MTYQKVVLKITNWLSLFYYTNKLLSCLTNCFTLTKALYICIIVPYFIYCISVIPLISVTLVTPAVPVITVIPVILAIIHTSPPGHPSHLSHP